MWLRALFMEEIETFSRGPSSSWVCDPKVGRVIIVVLRQTFLGSMAGSALERTRKPVFIIPLPSEKITIDWDGI